MTFEDFLKNAHAKFYNGTADDMPDAFNDWLVQFDVGVWLYYAEAYARAEVALALEAARSKTKEEAEDLLDKAAVLTYRDLKLVASNADSCSHDWETLTLRKCRTCKAVEKSFDTETSES